MGNKRFLERTNRAFEVMKYLSEGHSQTEAKEEFGISVSTVNRDLDIIKNYYPHLYYQYMNTPENRNTAICKYIASGHTREDAANKFGVSVMTVSRAVTDLKQDQKNLGLYIAVKQQLRKNGKGGK